MCSFLSHRAIVKAFTRRSKAFTIIEVVIALVLLGIGILAVGQGYRAGRFFLRQSEHRAYAMSIVSVKMEEYLAKTYDALGGDNTVTGSEKYHAIDFNWSVKIEKRWEGDDPGTTGHEGIPYKLLTVSCVYNEKNLSAKDEPNEVRMINMVPYPAIHTLSSFIGEDTNLQAPFVNPPDVANGRSITRLTFNYETEKDLMIIYNISFRVTNSNGLRELDTIYTGCVLDNSVFDIVTRTPIMTQPLISNVLGVENIARDRDHTIDIRWLKDTQSGTISLKEMNVIVFATEHRH
ncbi:MAG: prepilin-type N-terminal cleavage/methylation domain-containing protein [Candidatus Omnitrophica bacterium]|nr:prepilin-type N-terminal cleavage/methylation domain-containing protein [Candidatus Omnitrophota bacterium]